ncbi:MAG: ATP-binding protein [Gammaproteobacteria bacterium]|jgi:two-component system sensor histidine kinase RegB
MDAKDPTGASGTGSLKQLFVLRNLVITSALLALPAVQWLADIRLPLSPLLLIIGVLGLVNLWTRHRIRSTAHIHDRELLLQLVVDVLAIAAALYFTGGASNPFAWFFLIPLIITATVLRAAATWLMAALTAACYSLLMFFFVPLGGARHLQHSDSFAQHVLGMWFGFVLSAALISWFVTGMARTLRERDRLLALAREQSLRDERLVALGTLATGAAHELGTPLATMAVIIRELERTAKEERVKRKLSILRDQIARCKRALSILSASAGDVRAESGGLVTVPRFLQDVIEAWKQQRVDASLTTDFPPTAAGGQMVNEYTLHQALINLLNNAADASPHPIRLKAFWGDGQLTIDIEDDGPGLHPGIASYLGHPKPSDKEYGMGLGLVLTHATIQRLGGQITLLNRDGGGTCTRVRLPLADIARAS